MCNILELSIQNCYSESISVRQSIDERQTMATPPPPQPDTGSEFPVTWSPSKSSSRKSTQSKPIQLGDPSPASCVRLHPTRIEGTISQAPLRWR
ncbi:hypothetical protein CDAR_309641 [Caerostris darwini]|uniref:Uncharacterized protein n=1 Tax=Caerostris darwini TaxID=1538125 RepID=A0AAV4VX81_9ARAC|nr:hypothetical protein CDAR_309641 [Caerostris darwini]